MVLQKKYTVYLGTRIFLMLLIFHGLMYYSFDVQADEFNYYVPLFLQGLGVGLIMVPTIIYIISSVPAVIGPSAAAIALAIRYLGFCISIALINFLNSLKSRHYNAFQDHLSAVDPEVKSFLHQQTAKFIIARGMPEDKVVKAANKLLIGRRMNVQDHVRFAMDYYEMMVFLPPHCY